MEINKNKQDDEEKEEDQQNQALLVEGIDFEWSDEGLMVLSRKYLLQRGYCCTNGCLNCPYD